MIDLIITTIILGIIGGITPRPVILISFSEILKLPEKGMVKGGMYVVFTGITEFFIGLFLVSTSQWLKIPHEILHGLAVLGGFMLIYISFQIYKIHKIEYSRQDKSITAKHIIILMLLNGPLRLFWISVCLPVAFKLGELVAYGEYLFIVIFEIFIVMGLATLLLGFNSFRSLFSNEKIVKKVFIVLSFLLLFIAIKILYSEFHYFYPIIKSLITIYFTEISIFS